MIMKRFGFLIVAVIGFSLVIASCKSTDVENRPLWTDASTIAQVFSPEEYVTGIGRAVTAEVAVNLADGNLAAYFSREIISVTSAQTNISSSDTGHGDESLLRDVTVVSESVLSGVEHTNPWFDKNEKVWYVCSYLNRKEAWEHYELVINQDKNNFYSFIESAEKEEDPFKRIAYLNEAKTAGQNYEKSILFSEILYQKGSAAYSSDRKILASLDEKISTVVKNIAMNVVLTKGTDERYKGILESIVSDSGFSVSSVKNNYDIIVSVDNKKQKFTDTVVANPEIKIEIKNPSFTFFTWTKTMDRVTGFTEAENLLDTKITRAVEKALRNEFGPAMKNVMR